MNVNFVLNTGTINIGPMNSKLRVREGVTFTNNGTVNAKGVVLIEGTLINTGRYNNDSVITSSSDSRGLGTK